MKTTRETDKFLETATPSQFSQYLTGDYTSSYKNLRDYLQQYMGAHSLETRDVIEKSLLNKNYAYQILNGEKGNPSRDRLIPLCLAMHMNLEDTNRALKISKAGTLYSKDPRDALIIMCINQKIFDVMKVNDMLYGHGFGLLAGM